MKKDAYFFPHFSNARHDRKIKRVIKELGAEGYGLYFMLLEVLREQVDFRYPLSDVDLLAEEFKTSEAKLNAVIRNYDLFQVDESDNFISLKLVFYLQPYIEKSERARLAAHIRWDKTKKQLNPPKDDANAYANALLEQSKCDADAMQREEKIEEESKSKKTNKKSTPEKETELELNIKQIRSCLPKGMTTSKSVAFDKLPKIIKQYGFDKTKNALDLYVKEVMDTRKSGFDTLKFVNESTFWNSRYKDYIEEDIIQQQDNFEIVFERIEIDE